MTDYLNFFYNIIAFIIFTPLIIKLFSFNIIILKLSTYILIFIFNSIILKYESLISVWIHFCLYSFFVCIYIFIYGAIETSVSIKILNFLSKKKVKTRNNITRNIILSNLNKRVNNLIKKKLIKKKQDRYILTKKGIGITRKLNYIIKILNLKNLGFYK